MCVGAHDAVRTRVGAHGVRTHTAVDACQCMLESVSQSRSQPWQGRSLCGSGTRRGDTQRTCGHPTLVTARYTQILLLLLYYCNYYCNYYCYYYIAGLRHLVNATSVRKTKIRETI